MKMPSSSRAGRAGGSVELHPYRGFSIDVRDTKLGPEVVTRDIPNIGEDRLKNLDETGIIRVGAEISSGDILIGKITRRGEGDLTAEERLLRVIFGEKSRDVKDTSLYLPHGERGKVVDIKIFSRERGDKLPMGVFQQIQVSIAQMRKISVGDKLADDTETKVSSHIFHR